MPKSLGKRQSSNAANKQQKRLRTQSVENVADDSCDPVEHAALSSTLATSSSSPPSALPSDSVAQSLTLDTALSSPSLLASATSSTSSLSLSWSASDSASSWLSTQPVSKRLRSSRFVPPQPSSTLGWNVLPAELFDRTCSFLFSPVWRTLLLFSAVSHRWSHLVGGEEGGSSDCWRYVPKLSMFPRGDKLAMYAEDDSENHLASGSTIKIRHWESAFRSLRRVRSLTVGFDTADVSLPAAVRLLKLLFPHGRSISPHPCSRGLLGNLSYETAEEQYSLPKRFRSSGSDCVLRSPSLRSVIKVVDFAPSTAALRHLASSERMMHLESYVQDVSAMFWKDCEDAKEPWMGASTLPSLGLRSLPSANDPLVKGLCRALPSLTHLHLRNVNNDALQYIVQHLGNRLTFLYLSIQDSLARSVSVNCSALRSLYITIDSTHGVLSVSEYIHLMPQLTELTVVAYAHMPNYNDDYEDDFEGNDYKHALIMAPLPATLTYFQLEYPPGRTMQVQTADARRIELHAALPSSLRCLSLSLPIAAITDTLLSSLPTQCPQLTHCNVRNDNFFEDLENTQRLAFKQKLQAMRGHLGAGVWCDNKNVVERQRLDKKWMPCEI